MREKVIEQIIEKKVIAIVRGIHGEDCLGLARALHEGGVDLMEATFDPIDPDERLRTADTIRTLVKEMGNVMTFGAGTVTTVRMVSLARDAGAQFIVSPNTDEKVIRATVESGMVSIPGALTPTEIKFAHDCGGDFIKVFPAGNMGVSYFKNIHAPLSDCRLLAVGNVNAENARDYIQAGCSGVGVAGCLFKPDWVRAKEWDRIIQATSTFIASLV